MGQHSSLHKAHHSTVRDALAYGALWKTERAKGTKGVEAKVAMLSSETQLSEALSVMAQAGVQAVPVKLGGTAQISVRRGMLKNTRSSDPKAHLPVDFVSLFDLRDLLELLFIPFANNRELEDLATKARAGDAAAMIELDSKADEVLAQPVSLITGRRLASEEARRDKRMMVASLDTPLQQVLDTMVETRYHRVLVVTCTDDHEASVVAESASSAASAAGAGGAASSSNKHVHEDEVLAVLTPSHVLGWVGRHARDPRPCAKLALGLRTVHTIGEDEPLVTGLSMLVDRDVSALAVVDGEGAITAALSAGMMRGFTKDRFAELGMTVGEFARQESWWAPIVVSVDAEPFCDIVDRLLAARAHHAWLINDRKKPVGILTLTDIVERLSESIEGAARTPLKFVERKTTANPDHSKVHDHVGLPHTHHDDKKQKQKASGTAAGAAAKGPTDPRLKTVYEG